MKSKGVYQSRSAAQTIRIAKAFAKTLKAGDVVALEGGLGSGKTTFMKGLAAGLGYKKENEVTSPTFTLMHVYPAKIPLIHFDLYRLETEKEIAAIGFDEWVSRPDAVVCVEWAEKAAGRLPRNTRRVRFEITGKNSRNISIEKS